MKKVEVKINGCMNEYYRVCKKCGKLIKFTDHDTYWDDSGSSFSTKLVNCTCCGTPNVLKYEEDSWLKNYYKTKENYNRAKRGKW